MASRKAMVILLTVCAAAMLASQTEAFTPIFTHSELPRMQVREWSKAQKPVGPQQETKEAGLTGLQEATLEEEIPITKLTAPAQIGVRMTSRQLEMFQGALEGLLRDAVPLDHLDWKRNQKGQSLLREALR